MSKRKSFIIHIDSLGVLDDLDDHQAATLFRAIKSYTESGEETLSGVMKAVFLPFKNQFDRDEEKYLSICERNRANGLNGGRKKPKETQNNPVGSLGTQDNPKEPDNKNDSKSDNDNENIITPLPPKGKKQSMVKPDDVDDVVWQDFISHRKLKKATVTETVIKQFRTESVKAGISLQQAIEICVSSGWQGFKADWINNGHNAGNTQANRNGFGTTGGGRDNIAESLAISEEIKRRRRIAREAAQGGLGGSGQIDRHAAPNVRPDEEIRGNFITNGN